MKLKSFYTIAQGICVKILTIWNCIKKCICKFACKRVDAFKNNVPIVSENFLRVIQKVCKLIFNGSMVQDILTKFLRSAQIINCKNAIYGLNT